MSLFRHLGAIEHDAQCPCREGELVEDADGLTVCVNCGHDADEFGEDL